MKWYVKNSDGKVFGPADDEKILAWVKDGRVDPFAGVSNDLKQWKLASLVPLFEMDWIVEDAPGRFYGPTHRAVIDDLIKTGSLSQSCRIYRDYRNGELEKEAAAARTEAERAMAEVQSEAERAIVAKDSEIGSLKAELARMKSEAEGCETRIRELEDRLASFAETKKREWEMEVVEPEIVAETPPASVREIFQPGKAQTLAALERQAQAELARMGASEVKKFFSFK